VEPKAGFIPAVT